MKNTLPWIALTLCISPALAGEKSFNTTKDGAGYEATLRRVGIPQSGGMVWPVLSLRSKHGPTPSAPLTVAKAKP
jgi:hypothetical protein